MRIGFLVHRDTYYKHFSPLIDEALKNGHQVFCFHDYSQPKDGLKGYQFPWLSALPRFQSGKPQAISFNGMDELLSLLKARGVQALVTLQVLTDYVDLHKELKKQGIAWVAIQSSGDLVSQALRLHLPDRYFVYSDAWIELSVALLSEQGAIKKDDTTTLVEKLKKTVKTVGFPEIDQAHSIDPSEVRAEWGIPKNKPVVLFLPFPFHCTRDRFWAPFIYGLSNRFLQMPIVLSRFNTRHIEQVWNKWNDKRVTMAIKRFCEKNNAYLLVKARKKEPPRKYLTKIADKVIYHDEGYYPATILKCLSIADICFNFFSFTVLETVPMQVPNICIAPSNKDYENLKSLAFRTIFEQQRQIFDWPGLSYILSIPEVIKLLPEKSIEDFPFLREEQNHYIQRFIGRPGDNYSKNAVNEIEKLINGKLS